MTRSKKGRLTGDARKEINERRARDAIDGKTTDVEFARVTKILGANHVRVSLPSSHGQVELSARIPNIFARRGATPITTRDVVTIYVGKDFDVDADDIGKAHYDITSILTNRQAYDLSIAGTIPKWMVYDDASAADEKHDTFDFDYGEEDVEEEEEAKPAKTESRKKYIEEDDVDIDDI
jgi:hypothetical protein